MLKERSYWEGVRVLELFNSIYQAGRWPVTIYPAWLRLSLTFLAPVAFAVTIPTQAPTGRLGWWTVLVATFALTAAIMTVLRLFWKAG